MIERYVKPVLFAMHWRRHLSELVTLRAEVRDLRRRERALYAANRQLHDHILQLELQRDAAIAVAERVLDAADAEIFLQ